MGNTMTGTAGGIFLMNRGTMRLAVAILACRQVSVFRMALGTGQLGMLGKTVRQETEGGLVTTGTDFLDLGYRIVDRQRCMHRMAGQAFRRRKGRHRAMGLMALAALWNPAVLLGVAGGTRLFSMLARRAGKQLGNRRMADTAAVLKISRNRNGIQRHVRVGMAVKAALHLFATAMRGIVAGGTLRHDLGIIVPQRVIGMEHRVAVRTDNTLMLRAPLPQPVEMAAVAPGAVLNAERLDNKPLINRVALSSNRRTGPEYHHHSGDKAGQAQITDTFLRHSSPLPRYWLLVVPLPKKTGGRLSPTCFPAILH